MRNLRGKGTHANKRKPHRGNRVIVYLAEDNQFGFGGRKVSF
jgi:hypothetical protein